MPRVRVSLKSNGNYWQAFWRDAAGPHARSLGNKSELSRRAALGRCQEIYRVIDAFGNGDTNSRLPLQ